MTAEGVGVGDRWPEPEPRASSGCREGMREGEERDTGEKPSNNTELLLCLTFFHGY